MSETLFLKNLFHSIQKTDLIFLSLKTIFLSLQNRFEFLSLKTTFFFYILQNRSNILTNQNQIFLLIKIDLILFRKRGFIHKYCVI